MTNPLANNAVARLRPLAGIVGRFRREKRGATAVEFALVAFPFFFLLSAIVESSLYFFAGQMLETAVDKVGRQVRTGQLDSNATEAEFKAAICSETALLFNCSGLMVDQRVAATFSSLGEPPGPTAGEYDPADFSYTAAGPSQIVRITATYEWPVFSNYVAAHLGDLNSGNAPLSAIAVFRTEPYPTGP